MNQMTLNVKKNFLSRTFSRCVAEMCPGITTFVKGQTKSQCREYLRLRRPMPTVSVQ